MSGSWDSYRLNNDQHYRFFNWAVLDRQIAMTNALESARKADGNWILDLDKFRDGLKIQTSWVASLTGWAMAHNVTIPDRVRELYICMIQVSKGESPIETVFVYEAELNSWMLSLQGTYDEIRKDCKSLLAQLSVAGMRLPAWWNELLPNAQGDAVSSSSRSLARAVEMMRSGLPQAVNDVRYDDFKTVLAHHARLFSALEVAQYRQKDILLEGLQADELTLKKVFRELYHTEPVEEEKNIV